MLFEEDFLSEWSLRLSQGAFVTCQVDNRVIGLNFFCSLYFYEHQTMEKREIIYGLCEGFNRLTGNALNLVYFGTGGVHNLGSKSGNLRGNKLNNIESEPFFLKLGSGKNSKDSAAFYFDSLVNEANCRERHGLATMKYSFLRIGIPSEWFSGEKRSSIIGLVRKAADLLEARQGYAGYGWALPLDSDDYVDFEATEHYLAHQFFGLDIDKPLHMRSGHNEVWSLEKGLRAPSWLTFVGDEWLAKLGGSPVVTERLLAHPEVQVHPYVGGLIVQAGESPDLYPVEDGVPEVMMHVAAILKPVRAQTLNLLSYARFDGDEELDEVFFDLDKCSRWLGRYDADSDWPSAERRKLQPSTASAIPERRKRRGLPGESVPVAGVWWSPAIPVSEARRKFAEGETFPDTASTEHGDVIWYLIETDTPSQV